MTNGYLAVIALVERLHRHFLEVVKLELEGLGVHDINNVQGMMLFNIGDTEMTVGELTTRGCYLGSNVSYNVKKMVENGYIVQERSVHDRRSSHVRLAKKGRDLRDRLSVTTTPCRSVSVIAVWPNISTCRACMTPSLSRKSRPLSVSRTWDERRSCTERSCTI